jgi:hypothetical protein
MNNTPETDQLEETDQHKVDEHYAEYAACRRCLEHARQLERERDEAREERDGYQLEIDIVIERLKGNRHPDDNGMIYEGEIDIKAIISQRDRLAEALEQILSYQGRFAEEDPESIATKALQSLNNFPQTPAK